MNHLKRGRFFGGNERFFTKCPVIDSFFLPCLHTNPESIRRFAFLPPGHKSGSRQPETALHVEKGQQPKRRCANKNGSVPGLEMINPQLTAFNGQHGWACGRGGIASRSQLGIQYKPNTNARSCGVRVFLFSPLKNLRLSTMRKEKPSPHSLRRTFLFGFAEEVGLRRDPNWESSTNQTQMPAPAESGFFSSLR
jgi:hypothetical protein